MQRHPQQLLLHKLPLRSPPRSRLTIAPTPTETPDPNKPSDATAKDPLTGEYTRTVDENGKTVIYIWKQFQFGADARNGISGHWFKSMMENGPINLTGYGENCQDSWGMLSTFTLNMNIYAVEGQTDLEKIGNIFHPDRESEWNKYNNGTKGNISCSSLSLPLTIVDDLFLRSINLYPNDSTRDKYQRLNDHYYPGGKFTAEGGQRYSADRNAFVNALINGEMTLKIGDESWVPRNGYEIYWINEAMAINDPTMHFVLWQYPSTKYFYYKIMVRNGKLIAYIAPGEWLKKELTWPKVDNRERAFRTIILVPLEAVIIGINTNEAVTSLPQHYGDITGTISGTMNDKPLNIDKPFIDFTSDK